MQERSRMSLAQRTEIDKMIEEGQSITQGVLPQLTSGASYYVKLWGDLRSSTPGDQPISLHSIHLMVGPYLHHVLPVLQGMDRVLFECVRERREMERQKAEDKARDARQRRGRG